MTPESQGLRINLRFGTGTSLHCKITSCSHDGDYYPYRLGVSQQLVPGLLKDLANVIAMEDSSSYPALVKPYKPLNIKLNKFESMKMHTCFLGCTKNIISKTHITVSSRIKYQHEFGTVRILTTSSIFKFMSSYRIWSDLILKSCSNSFIQQ